MNSRTASRVNSPVTRVITTAPVHRAGRARPNGNSTSRNTAQVSEALAAWPEGKE